MEHTLIRRAVVSGLERFGLTLSAFRLRELSLLLDYRTFLRNRKYASGKAPDGYPIPPSRLITLVAGTADIDWFLDSARTFNQSLRAMLSRNGIAIEEFDSILDFGCGCGRTIRTFHDLEHTRLLGSDYNPELIQWCRVNLPFAKFSVNGLAPPLSYEDDSVDFIYSFSVFTHLPENLQYAWIAELCRVLRPGGYLMLTTHGETYLDRLTRDERATFKRGEVVVRNERVAGTNLCSAFHPPEFLKNRLLARFELIEHASVSHGETGGVLQDMTLVRLG
jgi:SAM-dependent methyltransferase